MSDDKKPNDNNSTSPFKDGIKAVVQVCNSGLQSVQVATEGIRKPVQSSWTTLSEESATIGEKAKYMYQRRHEFGPQVILTGTILGAGFFGLRRGRLAAVIGGGLAGGLAYGVVYDQFQLENIPDAIFGKKD